MTAAPAPKKVSSATLEDYAKSALRDDKAEDLTYGISTPKEKALNFQTAKMRRALATGKRIKGH